MTYRVRFAPVKKNAPCLPPSNVTIAAAPPPANTKVTSQGSRGKFKSRTGCHECKRRRVKCDETFPVCLRCQRSQLVCKAVPRMAKWQTELPWLSKPNNPSVSLPSMSHHINKRLLQHWLEKTSQIMVLDPDNNPMSFPILAYLDMSPALVHALQSISAAHENFFDPSKLTVCLEERSQALSRFKEELQDGKELLPSSFLTIFLLGISSPWIENNLVEYGKEHLFGARAIMELLLSNDNSKKDPFTSFLVGVYIYWDMVTAFLVDPDEQQPLNTSLLFEAVQDMRSSHHPIIGYSVEILYLLGTLGRYCRQVVDGMERDFFLEATLEEQMLGWEYMQDGSYFENLSNAFRKHGLIMLYRICGRPQTNTVAEQAVGLSFEERTNEIVRQYALDIVVELSQVPMSSSHLNLQGIPLFTAGSELYADDIDQRIEVTQRLKALYSMNRLPMNLLAIRVLEDIWHLRDASVPVSWMEFMLQRKWRLMLG